MTLWGGIEGGGNKFVCAVGTGLGNIVSEAIFDTLTPEVTIGQIVTFFTEQQQHLGPLKGIGIGSFGPIDLHPNSPTFGSITTSPKLDWAQTDLAGMIKNSLQVPVAIDTDVNAAALAENKWGAAKGLDTFIYLTVGTGIGGGAMINGELVHGLLHPEMGHIMVPHDFAKDPFTGNCEFHHNCLEGLASGPAIEKRWGGKADELSNDHPAWSLEAEYLALGVVNYIYTISPQRIIMGGGVMRRTQLFPLICQNVLDMLNGYIQLPEIVKSINDYVVPPALGSKAGVLGAIALARRMF